MQICIKCGIIHPHSSKCNPYDEAIWTEYKRIAKKLRKRWGSGIMQRSMLRVARLYGKRRRAERSCVVINDLMKSMKDKP